MVAGCGRPPAAAALTLLLSLGASAPGLLRGAPDAPSAASLRAAALRAGEVHRLITYVFVYEDLVSLTCGAIIIWYFAGSFERNVGTAKHCFLTSTFAILSALLFLFLETFVSRVSEVEDVEGFMPVAFATLDGLGYCFCFDFPESVASKLDRLFPFSLLKRIPGLKYVPGSLAERRALESSKINPVPGTYPTQSYYSSSAPSLPAFQLHHPSAQSQGLHHSCTPGHVAPPAPQHSPAAGHSLSPAPHAGRGAFGAHSAHPLAAASPGQCCPPGGFSPPQSLCPPDPQAPTGLGPLAGVRPASGCPAATVASLSP